MTGEMNELFRAGRGRRIETVASDRENGWFNDTVRGEPADRELEEGEIKVETAGLDGGGGRGNVPEAPPTGNTWLRAAVDARRGIFETPKSTNGLR